GKNVGRQFCTDGLRRQRSEQNTVSGFDQRHVRQTDRGTVRGNATAPAWKYSCGHGSNAGKRNAERQALCTRRAIYGYVDKEKRDVALCGEPPRRRSQIENAAVCPDATKVNSKTRPCPILPGASEQGQNAFRRNARHPATFARSRCGSRGRVPRGRVEWVP